MCHPPCFSPPIQLSYRRQRHKEINTLTTANSTAELTLPEEEDDYIILIRTLSEGGLGPASDPVRIHQLSKLARGVVAVQNRKFKEWFQFSLPLCETDIMETFDTYFHLGPQSLTSWIFHYLPTLEWSHLTLPKLDRDILSSVDLPLVVSPTTPVWLFQAWILLKYAAQSISVAEVDFLFY